MTVEVIRVPNDSDGFVVDNSLEYLVFKIPNYKNWVTDDILTDYDKLQNYLKSTSDGENYKTSGMRLHGKYKLLGVLHGGVINFLASPQLLSEIKKQADGSNDRFVVLEVLTPNHK